MAVLTIRNLPDDVRDRLRVRAAQSGTSLEGQVRSILTSASLEAPRRAPAPSLQQWVDRLYGKRKPRSVVKDLLDTRRAEVKAERRRP
jgi:hypothetical protein